MSYRRWTQEEIAGLERSYGKLGTYKAVALEHGLNVGLVYYLLVYRKVGRPTKRDFPIEYYVHGMQKLYAKLRSYEAVAKVYGVRTRTVERLLTALPATELRQRQTKKQRLAAIREKYGPLIDELKKQLHR